MVAHNMICFVEGGSQGHSEREEEKTDVCSPKRLCNACGRKGPVSQEEEKASGRQTDRWIDGWRERQVNRLEEMGRKEGSG